jgi:hypothetical protein
MGMRSALSLQLEESQEVPVTYALISKSRSTGVNMLQCCTIPLYDLGIGSCRYLISANVLKKFSGAKMIDMH